MFFSWKSAVDLPTYLLVHLAILHRKIIFMFGAFGIHWTHVSKEYRPPACPESTWPHPLEPHSPGCQQHSAARKMPQSPLKLPSKNLKLVFQTSFFRGYVEPRGEYRLKKLIMKFIYTYKHLYVIYVRVICCISLLIFSNLLCFQRWSSSYKIPKKHHHGHHDQRYLASLSWPPTLPSPRLFCKSGPHWGVSNDGFQIAHVLSQIPVNECVVERTRQQRASERVVLGFFGFYSVLQD